MPVPPEFQFSQASLQDYVDCPRRFQLRYRLHVVWPAVEAEPLLENEHRQRMGDLFHRLAHQRMLGVPLERLSNMAANSRLGGSELEAWWQNYLAFAESSQPERVAFQVYPEISLGGCAGGANLIAKYDAIQVCHEQPSSGVTILDWKTSRRRPKRSWLASRLQTRVYPYLLVSVGSFLTGSQALEPDQVEMVYWFTAFPGDPERFLYTVRQYEEDGVYITGLIHCIQEAGDETFPSCSNPEVCKFCVYRSLCERGVEPGNLLDAEESRSGTSENDNDRNQVDLDFEQIAEISFE